MEISSILKGIGGKPEWTRVLGTIGVAAFILVGNGLVIYQCWYLQKPFDIVAYCAAYPSGLGIAIGVIATAAGFKDRNVAAAAAANTATTSTPVGELPESQKLP